MYAWGDLQVKLLERRAAMRSSAANTPPNGSDKIAGPSIPSKKKKKIAARPTPKS